MKFPWEFYNPQLAYKPRKFKFKLCFYVFMTLHPKSDLRNRATDNFPQIDCCIEKRHRLIYHTLQTCTQYIYVYLWHGHKCVRDAIIVLIVNPTVLCMPNRIPRNSHFTPVHPQRPASHARESLLCLFSSHFYISMTFSVRFVVLSGFFFDTCRQIYSFFRFFYRLHVVLADLTDCSCSNVS